MQPLREVEPALELDGIDESRNDVVHLAVRKREVRRDIARLNGEMRKREVAQMTETQVAGRSKIRERRRKS